VQSHHILLAYIQCPRLLGRAYVSNDLYCRVMHPVAHTIKVRIKPSLATIVVRDGFILTTLVSNDVCTCDKAMKLAVSDIT
jgi:hypothetical protein